MHRHRRARTEDAGLVTRAGDHAAAAEPADQHRPAPQRRPGQLLHRREERVHVEVQHPPARLRGSQASAEVTVAMLGR